MRLGGRDQAGRLRDRARHSEQDDQDFEGIWYGRHEDDQREWGRDADFGWTATYGGEWHYQEYDDVWACCDGQGNLMEYYEADYDETEAYFG